MEAFLCTLGDEITDVDEETFVIFTQPIPSQDLGLVDVKATCLSLTIENHEYEILQSPTLLSSKRIDGTTGAVLWKVTPIFARWLTWGNNCLFRTGIIGKGSTVLELGCGSSGLIALVTAPKVAHFVATDQDYVFRLLRRNIEENFESGKEARKATKQRKHKRQVPVESDSNIQILALDWETSMISDLPKLIGDKADNRNVDLLVACDCIYNENLGPFITTCVEICRSNDSMNKPTICIIAQQLRSDTVFQAWLSAFHAKFRVWRIPDTELISELKEGSGFVVHVGIRR